MPRVISEDSRQYGPCMDKMKHVPPGDSPALESGQ